MIDYCILIHGFACSLYRRFLIKYLKEKSEMCSFFCEGRGSRAIPLGELMPLSQNRLKPDMDQNEFPMTNLEIVWS